MKIHYRLKRSEVECCELTPSDSALPETNRRNRRRGQLCGKTDTVNKRLDASETYSQNSASSPSGVLVF